MKTYGRWTVLGIGTPDPISGNKRTLCKCECGVERLVSDSDLRRGKSISCGCFRKEVVSTHSQSKEPEYRIWVKMKHRCCNQSYSQFKDYGGRGITVCERWLHSFENFYADMGPRPSPKHEIDRKDNSEGYSPSNCRWATRIEQQRNKRTNRLLTINGKTQTASAWADESGTNAATIYTRLWNGWSEYEAVFTPVGSRTRWKHSANSKETERLVAAM